MNKKLLLTIAVPCYFLVGCAEPIMIGKLNMLSNRNIDSKGQYISLKSFAGSGKRELAEKACDTFEESVDKVVRAVPGGEYLMNVKLYRVGKKYAVEGDVWSISTRNDIRGFKVNDIVIFSGRKIPNRISFDNALYKGQIIAFIDDQKCYVKYADKKGKDHEITLSIDDLTKQ